MLKQSRILILSLRILRLRSTARGRYLDLIQRHRIPNTVSFITSPATAHEIEGPTDKGYPAIDLERRGEENGDRMSGSGGAFRIRSK